jgi:excinuclease ABC subunit A
MTGGRSALGALGVQQPPLRCEACARDYLEPEPRLFDYNSPWGACPQCEGFGDIVDIDMDLVVPNPAKSIREGAIAPWNTPAYAHELQELLALADDYGCRWTCRSSS